MKKGLRRSVRCRIDAEWHSNSRPDEEGIKTVFGGGSKVAPIPTADLMKKGLRRGVSSVSLVVEIPTADLMKKGLRLRNPSRCVLIRHSNSRPDEEGIKTGTVGGLGGLIEFQQQT